MDDNKLERLNKLIEETEQISKEIEDEAKKRKDKAKEAIVENVDFEDVDQEQVQAFANKPYKILPKDKDEAYIVTPRFVPFNVGWLHDQDDAWNTFIINKYVDWIDELPDDIRNKVGIKPDYDNPEIEGDTIQFETTENRDKAWDDFGGRDGGLYARKGDKKIKVKKGSEFDVIAKLVDKGHLPFKPKPIDKDKIREPPENIQLRTYQERAWDKIKKSGRIGIYWPPGAGKTFVTLWIGDRIKGKKLVVVPQATLKEQWKKRINELCRHSEEWEVQTYQYITNYHLDDYKNEDITLAVFDEAHHLPANSFSKLATLDIEHTIGLSASPYREDGRTDYIFALTGYPVGLEWQELVEIGAVKSPDVYVYLYTTSNRKRNDLETVLNEESGKTLIFCDSINKGKRLSKDLDVPFVHGETKHDQRHSIIDDNKTVIGSRVADEGLSKNFDTTIEFDFHGKSKRQETQRAGRVMHGDSGGKHILMMTDDEFDKHSERLYGLEEKGFRINHVRRK